MKDFTLNKLSPEELAELGAAFAAEQQRREAMANLPRSKRVKAVHDVIEESAKSLGVEEDEMRLAEMATFSGDFPALVAKVNKHLEEWKRNNATYRDPDDPKNVWYSPDGKGNPPRWVQDIAGKKPEGKDQAQLNRWLKKLERYKVRKRQARKRA